MKTDLYFTQLKSTGETMSTWDITAGPWEYYVGFDVEYAAQTFKRKRSAYSNNISIEAHMLPEWMLFS